MKTTMFDPKIVSANDQQGIVSVYMRLAVTCSIIHDGVVQHGALALRGVCHFVEEGNHSIALELIVGS